SARSRPGPARPTARSASRGTATTSWPTRAGRAGRRRPAPSSTSGPGCGARRPRSTTSRHRQRRLVRAMVADLLRKQVYRPEALRLLLADALGRRHPVLSTSRHLDEAAQWILRAQSGTGDDGVSVGYTLEDEWLAHYPSQPP